MPLSASSGKSGRKRDGVLIGMVVGEKMAEPSGCAPDLSRGGPDLV